MLYRPHEIAGELHLIDLLGVTAGTAGLRKIVRLHPGPRGNCEGLEMSVLGQVLAEVGSVLIS